jgi:hypothetical protein
MAGDDMTTPQNGNGYTTKDVLNRLEGKVDAFITTHTAQHAELMTTVQKLATDIAIHTADEHPKKVQELHDAGQRELGRRDMLRILFGTSVMGALLGAAGLIMNVVDKLNGK